MEGVDGPKHAGVVTFHRLDDNTRVTAEMDIDPEGFVENVADKLGILDRRVKGDLKRFKEFIEARGSATGAWRGDVDRPVRAHDERGHRTTRLRASEPQTPTVTQPLRVTVVRSLAG